MSIVYFGSDFHIGHAKITTFRPQFADAAAHNDRIASDWLNTIKKRDIVYCLGDMCFNEESIEFFEKLPGTKILVRGNHDTCKASLYLRAFNDVMGIVKYKKMWLSHAPVHPDELRDRPNLHGHVHNATINDSRYLNCCPENLWPTVGRCLISIDQVKNVLSKREAVQ
jgi:calcineurin-like phosphoesterase family protein